MDEVTTALQALGALLCLIEATRKIVVHRRADARLGRDYMAGALAWLAVTTASGIPAVVRWAADAAVDMQLIHTVASMGVLLCTAGFVRSLQEIRVRVRASVAVIAAGGVVLVTLYAVWRKSGASSNLVSVVYTTVYALFGAVWLLLFAAGIWRAARREDRELRTGVALSAFGALVAATGLAWTAIVAAYGFGHHAWLELWPAMLCAGAGPVFVASGSVYAAATRCWLDRRERRECDAIEDLYRLLRPVAPSQAPWAEEPQDDVEHRIIAIWDTRMYLKARTPDHVCALAADIARSMTRHPDTCLLIKEAVLLRVAVELSAQRARDNYQANAHAAPQQTAMVADDQTERAWLVRLARTIQTASVTHAVIRMRADESARTREACH